MTDLTDKWKKGELPSDRYYTLVNGGSYEDYTSTQFYNEYTNEFDKHPLITKQVLAKVPTYEEYQALLSDSLAKQEGEEINAELVQKMHILNEANMKLENEVGKFGEENEQLKKWCEEFNALDVAKENTKLKTDCKILAQKLLQVKPELREWLEVNYKEYL